MGKQELETRPATPGPNRLLADSAGKDYFSQEMAAAASTVGI